jgi:predicted nucleic acid-binding protein
MESACSMIVHLDTCVLVEALTGPRRLLSRLERTITAGDVIAASTLVLYEWVRGPRTQDELEDQEALLPAKDACAFGAAEAAAAAQLYRALRRARGRDMDIAIAACAIERGARLWTLNVNDFRDMPGLELYEPA